MKNIAIILCSGKGTRFGTLKQFINLNNKPLLIYSLQIFNWHSLIDEIIIVNSNEHNEIMQLCKKYNINKLKAIVAGGKERYHSTFNALEHLKDIQANVLIHDSARPFVTFSMITDCLNALNTYNCATVAMDATDTIALCCDGFIDKTPDRNLIKHIQTPQAFNNQMLYQAFRDFLSSQQQEATDDAGIFKRYFSKEKIKVINGHQNNLKITHKNDIKIAEIILNDIPSLTVVIQNHENLDIAYKFIEIAIKTTRLEMVFLLQQAVIIASQSHKINELLLKYNVQSISCTTQSEKENITNKNIQQPWVLGSMLELQLSIQKTDKLIIF